MHHVTGGVHASIIIENNGAPGWKHAQINMIHPNPGASPRRALLCEENSSHSELVETTHITQ